MGAGSSADFDDAVAVPVPNMMAAVVDSVVVPSSSSPSPPSLSMPVMTDSIRRGSKIPGSKRSNRPSPACTRCNFCSSCYLVVAAFVHDLPHLRQIHDYRSRNAPPPLPPPPPPPPPLPLPLPSPPPRSQSRNRWKSHALSPE